MRIAWSCVIEFSGENGTFSAILKSCPEGEADDSAQREFVLGELILLREQALLLLLQLHLRPQNVNSGGRARLSLIRGASDRAPAPSPPATGSHPTAKRPR